MSGVKGFYLYILKSTECNKQYVGITNNIDRRFKSHMNQENIKWKKLTKAGKAVRRYGAKTFSIRIMAESEERNEIVALEKEWIKRIGLKRLWNSNCGGAYCKK